MLYLLKYSKKENKFHEKNPSYYGRQELLFVDIHESTRRTLNICPDLSIDSFHLNYENVVSRRPHIHILLVRVASLAYNLVVPSCDTNRTWPKCKTICVHVGGDAQPFVLRSLRNRERLCYGHPLYARHRSNERKILVPLHRWLGFMLQTI